MADEDHEERLQRETLELLNELRVVLPGVQVLLAFLLTAPFNQRFTQLDDGQEAAYFTSLAGSTVAVALLIAPTTYHRLRFRSRDKERLLRLGNTFVVVGTAFLAAAMTAAVGLVTDLVYGGAWTWVVSALTAVLLAGLWYALPLSRRASDD
jgi:amino acid transporter